MFQTVNTLTKGRKLISIPPWTTVREALALMVKNDYSQLPVIDVDYVTVQDEYGIEHSDNVYIIMGLFTQRHLLSLLDIEPIKIQWVLERPVTEFMDSPALIVQHERNIHEVASLLANGNDPCVIVEAEGIPIGIITDNDISMFLADWSEGAALAEGIETYLRACIEHVFPTSEERRRALIIAFGPDKDDATMPARKYDDLTLWEHQKFIIDKSLWPLFERFLESRETFIKFLRPVIHPRNKIAHFRGKLTPAELNRLRAAKEWLTKRARAWTFPTSASAEYLGLPF